MRGTEAASRSPWPVRQIIPIIALLLAFMLSAPAVQAQCLKDTRAVKFGKGSAQLLTYLCKAGAEGAGQIRVEFHTLSDAAAGSLLAGKPWPELAKILGRYTLIENAVSQEANNLLDRFGAAQDVESLFYFQAKGGKASEKVEVGSGVKSMRYLAFPDTEGMTGGYLPLPEADAIVKNTTGWPEGFNFWYEYGENCKKPEEFGCVRLWRYLNADDIAQYETRWHKQNEALGLNDPGPDGAATGAPQAPGEAVDAGAEAPPDNKPDTKDLRLIEYLTRDGWPEDFVAAVGAYSPCGGLSVQYYPRQMALDVAVIENVSAKPLEIGELLGVTASSEALRLDAQTKTLKSQPAASIAPPQGRLAPGAKLLLPLRITFNAPKGLKEEFKGSLADARKFYALIQKLPPGTLLKEPYPEDEAKPVMKARESFKPPVLPKMVNYAYGPEVALTGLIVNGGKIILEDAGANFLELTAGEGYGSCPYLYAYDAAAKSWIHYGKIIHNANSKANEMTEEAPQARFALRFRLSEQEAEVSFIDRAALNIALRNGEKLTLLPADDRLKAADGRYARIVAGQSMEMRFALPPGVYEADVAASSLAVTGYYRTYGSLDLVSLPGR